MSRAQLELPGTDDAPRSSAPPSPAKKRCGFAAMPPEQVRAIASKGGRAAHAAGTAHKFTSAEARAAGKKGGRAPHVRRGRTVTTLPPVELLEEHRDRAAT